MSGFTLHSDAFKDLDEIWEFVSAGSLDAADRVIEEIYQAIQRLVTFPQLGHSRTDFTSRPLRFYSVGSYLVVYAPEEKPLLVTAVLHGRRNPRVIAAILRERK